jgi:hypothetical protein
MKRFLPVVLMFMCGAVLAPKASLKAQEIIKERAFEMLLPAGWTPISEVPQGFDIGFRKRLSDGREATLFLHYEIMPSEMGEPPEDTSDIERQWDAMVRNRFPDATPLKTPAVSVEGEIILNRMYDLTDGGLRVRRRYTYLLAERTAFIIQCTTPSGYWKEAVNDFDIMLVSIKPKAYLPEKKISDNEALSNLKSNLPTLVGSFPTQWACSIVKVKIVRLPSKESKGTLEITVAWDRRDITKIYNAVKILYRMMAEGKTGELDFEKLPDDVKEVSPDQYAGFMNHLGQIAGCAFANLANCESPIDRFKVVVLDSKNRKAGAVSISRKDLAYIFTSKLTEADEQRIARMFVFE